MTNNADSSNPRQKNVVVLGGSMAGLLAARVLADHADAVTVVERDRLAAADGGRKGVPQGRHAHGLLARGAEILEDLFPGIGDELAAAGAQHRDMAEQRWIFGGQRVAMPPAAGVSGVSCARPVLECAVRARVRDLANVEIVDNTDVLGLVADGDRVIGARVIARDDGSAERTIAADLVVDATGRGSRLGSWLERLGFQPPTEERVQVGIRYATAVARRRPNQLDGTNCVVVATAPPNRRCGVALAIGDDRWIITLAGYLGESPGRTWESMRAFAGGLPSPELSALMRDTEPVDDIVTATFPHSQRRRYDRLRRHPDGVVAFGDSLCSFNPVFGQGMSVAACEALELASAAARLPLHAVWKRFYRRSRKYVDIPWSIAVGTDLQFSEVEGRRTVGGRMLGTYLGRLIKVAATDPVVGNALIQVTQLLAQPPSLLRPRILARVARGPRRRPAGVLDNPSPA